MGCNLGFWVKKDFSTSTLSLKWKTHNEPNLFLYLVKRNLWFSASEDDAYDEKLCHPWARKVYKMLPGKRSCFLDLEQVTATVPQEKLRDNKM